MTDDTGQPTVDRLIAQLEAATAGSRELDWDIAIYAGLRVVYTRGTKKMSAQFPYCVHCAGGIDSIPAYTASIDAALTLLPEGWGFKADCGLGYGNTFTVGHVGANKLFDQPEGRGQAATPVLALCSAALQARQISQRETGAPLFGDVMIAHDYADPNDPFNSSRYHTGKPCIEEGCNEPAGTWWSKLWCLAHNVERMNRINSRFKKLRGVFGKTTQSPAPQTKEGGR